MKIGLLIFILLLLSGCIATQKGGRSHFQSPSGISGGVEQSENPKTDTTQVFERVIEGNKVTERVNTKIGSAQKDTAREMGAKLASLKGVVWVGLLLFVAGAASLVWPPLKAIVGSSTTSALAIAAGVALMALPSLIVGNEVLILCVGAGAVLLYWFSHRHGELRGQVKGR